MVFYGVPVDQTEDLSGKPKIYIRNIEHAIAAQYGTLVDNPSEADVPYDSKDPLYPFGFGLSY